MKEPPEQVENPYAAPSVSAPAVGVLGGNRADLRNVAVYQKGILICVLIHLLAVVGQFFVPPGVWFLIGLGDLGVGLVAAIFVFLLAIKVYGVAWGVVLALLCLIPIVGLVVLLVVNGKATGVLTQNGIKVGLLGADISKL